MSRTPSRLVAGDDVVVGEVASYLRIEEWALEAGEPN